MALDFEVDDVFLVSEFHVDVSSSVVFFESWFKDVSWFFFHVYAHVCFFHKQFEIC